MFMSENTIKEDSKLEEVNDSTEVAITSISEKQIKKSKFKRNFNSQTKLNKTVINNRMNQEWVTVKVLNLTDLMSWTSDKFKIDILFNNKNYTLYDYDMWNEYDNISKHKTKSGNYIKISYNRKNDTFPGDLGYFDVKMCWMYFLLFISFVYRKYRYIKL